MHSGYLEIAILSTLLLPNLFVNSFTFDICSVSMFMTVAARVTFHHLIGFLHNS